MSQFSKYIIKGKWQISIPLLAISGFLYTIGVSLFLYKADAFPTGTGAYAQLITLALNINPRYFSMFLAAFNIPFFIIFWKSLSKKFLLYTIIWTAFQLGWAQIIFTFDIFVHSNPLEVAVNANNTYSSSGRVLYALVGSIISGFAIGIAFLSGGSTAGTDLFVYYLYTKHKKSIGSFEIIVGISTAFSAVIIQYIIGGTSVHSIFNLIFGITTFITFMYISLTGVIMNIIYPRHKKVRLRISSKKMKQITDYLTHSEFHHPFAIRKEHSIYTKKDNEILTTVIYYLESSNLISELQKIDENIWVSVAFVEHTIGNFSDKLLT